MYEYVYVCVSSVNACLFAYKMCNYYFIDPEQMFNARAPFSTIASTGIDLAIFDRKL